MASITFAVDEELQRRLSKFAWVNWSEVTREELRSREALLSKLQSKEENELTLWAVELGRKAKKGRLQKLRG